MEHLVRRLRAANLHQHEVRFGATRTWRRPGASCLKTPSGSASPPAPSSSRPRRSTGWSGCYRTCACRR